MIKIYPNPVESVLWIENTSIAIVADLFDGFGKKVLTRNIEANILSKIDVEALPQGIYTLQWRSAAHCGAMFVVVKNHR